MGLKPDALLKRLPDDPSTRLAAVLGAGLFLGWVGQFATPLFDRHPALGLGLALINTSLALALAAFGKFRQVPREALWGLAGLVLAGTLFLVGAKWGYSRTLGGFEGYALPRQAIAYGPEARNVNLTASDRTTLKATYLGRAKGERPAGKAILIVPGWLSTRQSFSTATLALWFHPEYDVLVLDPRGQGDSGGAQQAGGAARFDILAGVAFLKAQGNETVGVLAEREGAYAAVLAAAEGAAQGSRARLIDSLVLASPVAQWGEPALGGGFWRDPTNPIGRLTWRVAAGVRLKGGAGQPLAEVLPKLAGTPLMLTGPQDDPQGLVRQLHLMAPEPRSLRLFAGSGQPVAWKAYHRYYEAARQFFGMTLSNAPQASVQPAEGELPPELLQAIEDAAKTP
ncbi:Alpha/beta hydrolase family protein [compost metagenome]